MRLHARAPGKVNLCLFLGAARPADGRHELVSVLESVSLADELVLELAAGGTSDEIACPGVDGPNLAGAALAAYRAHAGAPPPVRLRIAKHVPVAAGMGGGSGDAAAALRLAAHAAGRPHDPELLRLAAGLGADVPSQVVPGSVLATGAGEIVESVRPRARHGLLILPSPHRLVTAAVFEQADRLGLARASGELEHLLADVAGTLACGDGWPAHLAINDLEPAARALCPSIAAALADARAAGAAPALVAGSGPTVVGWFWGEDGPARAATAAAELRTRHPGAMPATPVGADFGAVREG